MDQHLGIVLDRARRRAEGAAPDDDVYVWWAKLASANRQQPMPHRYQGSTCGHAARSAAHGRSPAPFRHA